MENTCWQIEFGFESKSWSDRASTLAHRCSSKSQRLLCRHGDIWHWLASAKGWQASEALIAGDQGSAICLQAEAFGYWEKLEDNISLHMTYDKHLEIGALHFAMAVHRLEGFDPLEQRHLAAEAVRKALSISSRWRRMPDVCSSCSDPKYFFARYLADQDISLHSLQPIPILDPDVDIRLCRLAYRPAS